MAALQFSQEGQLGQDVRYNIDAEMLVTSDTTFALAVTNVPSEIRCSFVDSTSGARVTSVRFTEETSKLHLRLELSIPEKLDPRMVNVPIAFQTWILDTPGIEELNTLQREAGGKPIEADALKALAGARCDLILIPKGIGRVETLMTNLYVETKPHENTQVKLDVQNSGTLPLSGIKAEVMPPLGWTVKVSPESVAELAPGEKKQLTLELAQSQDAVVGEFEAVIAAKGQCGSETVRAQEKTLRIRVRAESGIGVTLAVLGGIVALVVVVVIMGIKLSRR